MIKNIYSINFGKGVYDGYSGVIVVATTEEKAREFAFGWNKYDKIETIKLLAQGFNIEDGVIDSFWSNA